MGANPSDTGATNAVGDALTAVLPQDGKPWYKRGHLIALNFAIISLVMFSSANGFDGSLMNGLQALDQWQAFMDSPTGSWLGLINAVYWLGAGITYPAAAWISNTYGRKPGIYLGYVFLILGSVLQTAAQNDVQFILARMFVGIASALLGSGAPLLINEIAYPTQRGVTSALFMCGWYVGGTIAAFATFATRNYTSSWAWRVPSILQLLLPLVALPGLIMAPESPRWLISVDRPEEAREILVKYHAGGDPDSALVNYEIIEIGATLRAEKEAHNSASYKDMIKTPGNRHRLFISVTLGVFSQWSGNGHVTYYLSLVLDTVGVTSVTDQTLISGFLQVWNLILSVAAAFSVDKFGRRPLFLASAAIMLVSYILVTALSGSFAQTGHGATGIAVIPFLYLFFAGYDIALTPFLTAYPCEIWPFALRSRGLTVTWLTAIVAISFNTFVNPIALAAIGWKYYIVFVVILVFFCLTTFFFYPETRGHTLEQMAVIFDRDSSKVPNAEETVYRSLSAGGAQEAAEKEGSLYKHTEKV